jgi:hypothetical protein
MINDAVRAVGCRFKVLFVLSFFKLLVVSRRPIRGKITDLFQ